MFKVPEKYRHILPVTHPQAQMFNSIKPGEKYGTFKIPLQNPAICLFVIGTDAHMPVLWEHVSVSVKLSKTMKSLKRCPTWEEMCRIKDLFWDKEDCVIQFHPPESEYVSCHDFTLHLWRKQNENLETPPSVAVGPTKTGQKT